MELFGIALLWYLSLPKLGFCLATVALIFMAFGFGFLWDYLTRKIRKRGKH